MKENKLSREDILKWIDERIKSLSTRLESSQNFGWHDKVAVIEHELSFWKQIKFLLAPIPKDILKKFVDKWAHTFMFAYKSESARERFIRMLKEYEALKEGK